MSRYRLGIDVGGTFTDVVLLEEASGAVTVAKVLNRHADRWNTVVEGVQRVLCEGGAGAAEVAWISHGTTITTNAVIERKGAKTALITNKGFRDVLEIGRFSRPAYFIYRVHEDKPEPLVPRHLRLGVACRVDRQGDVVADLDAEDLARALAVIQEEAVESVAVCFLFSFLEPRHEEAIRARLAQTAPHLDVVLSSEILREFREFPRTATTVFAAYVAPALRRYLAGLGEALGSHDVTCPLYIFQSNGGIARPDVLMRNPALTLLSGPAGAVVGAAELCAQARFPNVVTMDMGGTSLDVCVVRDGRAQVTTAREIDYFPLAIPMLDIHTVGAGGGSVVHVDNVNRVHLGPQSMGADPGPACYALGGDVPTLTDVNLLLGLLDPRHFANGEVPLDAGRAEAAVAKHIAGPLGIPVAEAAVGIYQVATNQIAEAIRAVTVERGNDPRDLALVAFGGGGPVHAAAVAAEIGIDTVLVPRYPGLFSARGIASADFHHDYAQSVLRPLTEVDRAGVERVVCRLAAQAEADLEAEGIPAGDRTLAPSLDLRYVGQTSELNVPLEATTGADWSEVVRQFNDTHQKLYSYAVPGEPIELVNVRLKAVGHVSKPPLPVRPRASAGPEVSGWRPIRLPGMDGPTPAPVYLRAALMPGHELAGPLVVEEGSSTTIVPGGWGLRVDDVDNLILAEERA